MMLNRQANITRVPVGALKDPLLGVEYELAVEIQTHAPIIRNPNTGKSFIISWPSLLVLARSEGLDEQETRIKVPGVQSDAEKTSEPLNTSCSDAGKTSEPQSE